MSYRTNPEQIQPRVPTGQYITSKMPVMTLGATPQLSTADWGLRVTGLVDLEVEMDWGTFLALPRTTEVADFHCVTQWSCLNVTWEGVPASAVLDLASPQLEARYVLLHSADRYTTNVELEVLQANGVIFAHKMDGEPLPANRGYPVRLIVPTRYGWKSAKWVVALELMSENRPGFWETNGYHMRGNPWCEERFSHRG